MHKRCKFSKFPPILLLTGGVPLFCWPVVCLARIRSRVLHCERTREGKKVRKKERIVRIGSVHFGAAKGASPVQSRRPPEASGGRRDLCAIVLQNTQPPPAWAPGGQPLPCPARRLKEAAAAKGQAGRLLPLNTLDTGLAQSARRPHAIDISLGGRLARSGAQLSPNGARNFLPTGARLSRGPKLH